MIGYGNSLGVYLLNPYIYGAAGTSYLLDTYSANVGYSLRKISNSSTSAIRVRRTSDNAEQDIGYDGDGLDVASLETFCTGTDGYVVKWYNQGAGGSTYDFVQPNVTFQPQIVSSGSVLTSGSVVTMKFTSGQLFTTNTTLSDLDNGNVYSYHHVSEGVSGVFRVQQGASTNSFMYFTNTSTLSGTYAYYLLGYTGDIVYNYNVATTSSFIGQGVIDTADTKFWHNNTLGDTGTWSGTRTNTGDFEFKCSQVVAGGGIYVQEYVLYDYDFEPDRTDIVTDINNYFSKF